MTRTSWKHYDDAELAGCGAIPQPPPVREKGKAMHLGEKAILSAVAIIIREQRDEHRKAIAALEARIEALERETPKRLRAVNG
jgi:hypothetical protein